VNPNTKRELRRAWLHARVAETAGKQSDSVLKKAVRSISRLFW